MSTLFGLELSDEEQAFAEAIDTFCLRECPPDRLREWTQGTANTSLRVEHVGVDESLVRGAGPQYSPVLKPPKPQSRTFT